MNCKKDNNGGEEIHRKTINKEISQEKEMERG